MSCRHLYTSLDFSCVELPKKYVQQVVLIDKSKVEEYYILTPSVSDSEYDCRYRIAFRLLEDEKGIRINLPIKGASVNGTFNKYKTDGVVQYRHNVTIPMFGVDEQTKCILDQIDFSNYFIALQHYSNVVEIFGFENGLTTGDYEYNPLTGVVLTISSVVNENFMPFVYYSQNGTEIEDFNNNFENTEMVLLGDFNDDFNDDFDNL